MKKPIEDWTFDEAVKAEEEWEVISKPAAAGKAFIRYEQMGADRELAFLLSDNVRGPLFRWIGVQELRELGAAYEKGHKEAILEAVFTCALNSIPLPEWLETAFLKAYRNVRQYRAKSWDDVFGKAHKKGTQLATKRQEREKSLSVYHRIRAIKRAEPSTPIDDALFERVAGEFHIGSSTMMKEYYYAWKHKLKTK